MQLNNDQRLKTQYNHDKKQQSVALKSENKRLWEEAIVMVEREIEK